MRRSVSCLGLRSKPNLKINPIQVSDEERSTAQLSHRNIQRSLEEFHENGLVILEHAVTHQSIENVYKRMLQDFNKNRISRNVRWNQGREAGNISQPLPSFPEYLHEDIWANRLSVNVMENIIGPRPQLALATSNIALPKSTGRQAVHSDYYCEHLDFTVFLEVNIYLHDVDSRNGATEFWLGTHKGYSKDDHSSPTAGWIKREVFTSRATVSPPIQPSIPKGSLMIRDLRCWHAGRQNRTDEPRIILGFIYGPRWFDTHMRMVFPSNARSRLQSWSHIDCIEAAEFVEGDFNYLDFHQDINLTQVPSDPTAPAWIGHSHVTRLLESAMKFTVRQTHKPDSTQA
jgi:ectoine hydroxylase-related dioxygenase (phytanoyl-CoA dioxygenase family)